jgi:hypothetical protein
MQIKRILYLMMVLLLATGFSVVSAKENHPGHSYMLMNTSNNVQDMTKTCQKQMNTILNNKIHYVFSVMTKEQLLAVADLDTFDLNKDELNTMDKNDIVLKFDDLSSAMSIKDKHKMMYSLLPIMSKEQLVTMGQYEMKMMDIMMAKKMMGEMDEKQLKNFMQKMPAGNMDTDRVNMMENMDSMMMNMDQNQVESMVEKMLSQEDDNK